MMDTIEDSVMDTMAVTLPYMAAEYSMDGVVHQVLTSDGGEVRPWSMDLTWI